MANIMITSACNLRCPYCFANEFVNVEANHIEPDAFAAALDFVLGDGTQRHVGLIGGEPTLHPRFKELLRMVIADRRAERATLYTNGLRVEPFLDELRHPKFSLLVNVNGPGDIGEERFARIAANIAHMVDDLYMRDRVTLGINMYKPDFEYGYMIDLLVRHGFTRVRTSITVPNVESGRNVDARPYFLAMKPQVKRFFLELLERGVTPYFDCNKIPSCLVDAQDVAEFAEFLPLPGEAAPTPGDPELGGAGGGRARGLSDAGRLRGAGGLLSRTVQCKPVVDVLQDLTAVRCFGLSEHTKARIADFGGIGELVRYYENTVDAFACNTAYAAECGSCGLRATRDCTGGCLAFKVAGIVGLREAAERLMAEGA